MDLLEYIEQNGQEPPQPSGADGTQAGSFRADQERGDHLKGVILRGLDKGTDPVTLLYIAADCIAALSHDPDYLTDCAARLDATTADTAQQSLLVDCQAVEQKRREQQQAEYNDRAARQLRRQLKAYKDVQDALQAALQAIEAATAAQPAPDRGV